MTAAPHRQSWSLKALLGLSIVLPLLVFAGSSWHRYHQELEDAEGMAVKTVAALHEHTARVLDTHELILAQIDLHLAGRSWPRIEADSALRQELMAMPRNLDQVRSIALLDRDGRIRMTSLGGTPANLDRADRDYFLVHREQAIGTYISTPFTSDILSERLIALSKRRSTSDGRFDGVIVVVVPVTYFTQFWERFAPTIGHVIPLVRADGHVIARYPASATPERLKTDGPFLGRALQRPQGVYRAVSQVDGVERLNAYTQVRNYPLFISFSIETDAILSRWHESVAIYGAYALLAALALSGLSWIALRQYRAQLAASRRWQETASRLSVEMTARETAEEALRQSQKMEAVGQITGGVAHDFNNLLQAIASNLHILSGKVPADARRFTEASMQAVERGSELVRQMMAFARRQSLEPRPVDVATLIAGMGTLLQKAVGDTVRIEVELQRHLDPVLVDATQTELAILNLAINARDAMAGGGRIAIAARNVAVAASGDGRIRPGDYVMLSVTDTGCGMTAETLARAFDPFFTTKEVGKGTGLGLSMVHGFINQSGGAVDIASQPGRGTTVSLYLPKSLVAPEAERRRPAAAPAAGGKVVLLVDDDALGRMSTALALRELGYQVHEARDGEEALTVLARRAGIELMVTDYAMPGMTGVDLAAAVRASFPAMPVIMITGYAAESFDRIELGLAAILRKPVRIAELTRHIDGVRCDWRALRPVAAAGR